MGDDTRGSDQGVSIGRIPLKQVRIRRGDEGDTAKPRNPMNALVPFLDLFCRLGDEELSRLAGVDAEVVANLRQQVIAVDEGLAMYADLLPRLSDEELVRLTGATPKTIRFWRLCQPRIPQELVRTPSPAERESLGGFVARAARHHGGLQSEPRVAGDRPSPSELEPKGPSDSGLHEQASHPGQATLSSLLNISGAPFPGYGPEDETDYPHEESGPMDID